MATTTREVLDLDSAVFLTGPDEVERRAPDPAGSTRWEGAAAAWPAGTEEA